jgi:hypothetical protein
MTAKRLIVGATLVALLGGCGHLAFNLAGGDACGATIWPRPTSAAGGQAGNTDRTAQLTPLAGGVTLGWLVILPLWHDRRRDHAPPD